MLEALFIIKIIILLCLILFPYFFCWEKCIGLSDSWIWGFLNKYIYYLFKGEVQLVPKITLVKKNLYKYPVPVQLSIQD